jgi:diguanylate cyclase (GGDEF)-like protein
VAVGALEFVSVVELVSDMFSVLLGTIVLFLVRRVIPRFGFLLHRRALGLIVVAALSFSVAEALAGVDTVAGPGTSMLVIFLEDLFEVLVIVLAGLAVVTLYRSERGEVASLRRSADLDDLTSLPNRSFFRRAAERRYQLSRENNIPLSCVVMDIDDFKPYNDTFGHGVGDRALICIAEALRRSARADDIVARYGGEEFVLLMNGDLEAAATLAERIRSVVERRCSPESESLVKRQLTISLGVASLASGTVNLADLLRAADEEMYRAKRAGKNRVYVRRDEGL